MSPKKITPEFDASKIDQIFAEVNQCHLAGAAVGIAIDGRPVYRKGFGLANMELPVLLSPTIRMRIGSTTKHFTSLAYMLLCEDGRAEVDETVGRIFPELHPVLHGITMRQLMGHRGGLRDVYDICFQFSGTERTVSSAELLSLYRVIDDLNAEPGLTFNYNNGGYLLLSAAIERISGKPLEDVLRERIFEPVGMYATLLRRLETGFVPNSSTGHTLKPGFGYEKTNNFGTDLVGAGAMVSTVDDMLLWVTHMDAPIVGSRATWELMKTPHRLANGASTNYGLGLSPGRYRGVGTLSHSGGGAGSNAQMLKVPAAGLSVVVMSNRSDVPSFDLAERVLDACLPGLEPVRQLAADRFVTGTFRSEETGRVIQLVVKDGRQVAILGGLDIPFGADENGVLRPDGVFRDDPIAITVSGDPKHPSLIRVSDYGNIDELIAVPRGQQSEASKIVGRYRWDATGTEALIYLTDDGPQLKTHGSFGSVTYKLDALAEGIWLADVTPRIRPPGVLSFDSQGKGFRYSSWQTTRGLPFRRCD